MNTTQGQMTAADLADHRELTDTHRDPNCPGHDDTDAPLGVRYCLAVEDCPGERPASGQGVPMSTARRLDIYGAPLTGPQRRRAVKKAGRDPEYAVFRDAGMGYPPAQQGRRELRMIRSAPVSGAPYQTTLRERLAAQLPDGVGLREMRPEQLFNIHGIGRDLTPEDVDALRAAIDREGYEEIKSWVATEGASWLSDGTKSVSIEIGSVYVEVDVPGIAC